jgi:hypothetical protein
MKKKIHLLSTMWSGTTGSGNSKRLACEQPSKQILKVIESLLRSRAAANDAGNAMTFEQRRAQEKTKKIAIWILNHPKSRVLLKQLNIGCDFRIESGICSVDRGDLRGL